VAVQVPIVLTGESSGARNSGGAVVQQLHYLEIEALPLEMPHQVEIDLVGLIDPDQVIRAGDIGLSGSSILLTAPDEVVVRIEMPKSELEAVEGEPAVGANDEGGARSTGA
jgi:large subunit ribosomal protein L25